MSCSVRRMTFGLNSLILVALMLLTACTNGGMPGDEAGQGCEGKCDEAEGTRSDTLAQHYLLAINVDLTVAENAQDDDPKNFTSRLVGIVDVDQETEQTNMTLRPCLVELPAVDGKQPYIPHEVVQQTSFSVFGASVESGSVRTSAGTVLGGVTLSDPVADALPSRGSDSQVWDVDEDGNPGLTVTLDGWEIYVGMRLKFSLDGRVDPERTAYINGDATLGLDLEIYGDNIPFVSARNRIGDLLDEIEVIEAQNDFEMRPIDASLATCAIAVDPSLIPEEPVEIPMDEADSEEAGGEDADGEEDIPTDEDRGQPDEPAN